MLKDATSGDQKEGSVPKLHEPSQRSETPSPESIRLGRLMDDLPEEILAEILCSCCPTLQNFHQGPSWTPLKLSQVSRKWRRIALDTPRMWTQPRLVVRGAQEGCLDKPLELLRLWLSRARGCPVAVNVVFDENPRQRMPDNVLSYVNTIIDAALEQRPAIRADSMKLVAAIDATADVKVLEDRYPRVLERYSWVDAEGRLDRPRPGMIQINVHRHASLVYALEGHAALAPYLVYLDLRDRRDIIWFAVEEAHSALSMFPQLEHCAIRLGYDSDHDPFQMIRLPRLRKLALFWNDSVDPGLLLDVLDTPEVRLLEMSGPLRSRSTFQGGRWGHLLSYLQRCQLSLFMLDLGSMDGTVIDIISCLAACRNLTHLTLMDCTLGEELINSWSDFLHPLRDVAWHTLLGLEYLALVGCTIYNANDLLLLASDDDTLWRASNLEQLYVFDCKIPKSIAEKAGQKIPIPVVEISDDRPDDDE